MLISEAQALNDLMKAVVLEGDAADDALEAAALLAQQANKALGAGLTPNLVRAKWGRR